MSALSDTILSAYTEDVIMLDRTTVPDGFGGIDTVWVDGAPFVAAITPDESTTAQIAQAQTEIKRYRITTDEKITLLEGSYIKRVSDGATFKILHSNTDKLTPNDSAIPMRSTTAERVKVPT